MRQFTSRTRLAGFEKVYPGRETNRIPMKKQSIGPRTVLYPHPVLVIGTYDASGRPNAMVAAWGGICSSRPPAVAVSVQKARQTYENLVEQREFTISIPSVNYIRETDYFGIVSGRDEDKFAATGLTPVKGDLVNAPYVGEFPVVLECRLLQTVEIGVHTQFIGEILDVKMEEGVVGEDGRPDLEKIRPIAYDSMRQEYYGHGKTLGKAFSVGKGIKR
ncbi:MAG: hypothetical protein PWQ46_1410 [Methanomicrobiaceae archaeon]|nr:hypothetical protein [Methanomicrobiaceae archaeon]